jgi:hypothetical protein
MTLMRQRLGVWLVGLVILFGQACPQPAAADEGGALRAFMGSSYYAGLIHKGLAALPPDEFRQCPTLVSNGSRVTILRPVAFDPNGFPNTGLWRQSFPVSGCGNDTIVNFYFLAEAGQKISLLIGMPGSTIASLLLQSAGRRFTTLAAQRVAPGCQSFTVVDTRFEGFEQGNGGSASATRPWRESWRLLGCGHRYTVALDFAPNERGTQVTLPDGVISDR